MKRSRSLPLALAMGAGMMLAACDAGVTSTASTAPGAPATVTGALATDGGNQHVTPGMASTDAPPVDLRAVAQTVSVATVDDTGALTIVGEGEVRPDGRYVVGGLPALRGPFLVQARDAADAVVGAAIVPEDLEPGRVVIAQPISRETTAEANILVTLAARTGVAADRVDGVALMTHVSDELAAAIRARDVATLADAAEAADEAYLHVLAGVDGEVNGQTVARARVAAWTQLAAALDGATDRAAEDAAWERFDARVDRDVAAATGVGLDRIASAEAAASVVFSKLADSRLEADAATHASINAMVRATVADHAAQRALLTGNPRTLAALATALDRDYADFEGAVRAARDADAAVEAFVTLSAGVADSVLGRFVAATDGPDMARAVVRPAMIAATAAAEGLDQALAAADDAADRVGAIVAAYIDYRAAVQAAVDGSLQGSLSTSAADFVRASAAQLGGHGRASLVGLRSVTGIRPGGARITGSVHDQLGEQSGADAMVEGARFDVLGAATSAALMSADASGALSVVATGSVDPATGEIQVDGVTEPVSGAAFLAVRDARDRILGMVSIVGRVEGTVDVRAPEITAETTVEARVLLAMMADGHRFEDIDVVHLEGAIDLAVAATVRDAEDVDALAEAIWLGQEVRDEALATEGDGVGADGFAEAQASAAYEASVAELVGSDTPLFAAVDARVQLDNAMALGAAATVAFGLDRARSRVGAVRTAVDALNAATAAATDDAAVQAAGDAFIDAIVGSPRSVVMSMTQGAFGLGARDQQELSAAIDGAMVAGEGFEGDVKVSVQDAIDAGGRSDTVADASGIVKSGASLRARLETSLSVPALAGVPAGERPAASVMIQQAAAGLYGSAGIE